MATHASILAWRIPWTEDPGRLQSVGSQRVRHDRVTSLSLSVLHCRRILYQLICQGKRLLEAYFVKYMASSVSEKST